MPPIATFNWRPACAEVHFLSEGGADGRLHIDTGLSVFASHFGRRPVLPAALLLDAVSALVLTTLERDSGASWTVVGVGRCRFRKFIAPGDTVLIQVVRRDLSGSAASYNATVHLAGALVASVTQIEAGRVGASTRVQ